MQSQSHQFGSMQNIEFNQNDKVRNTQGDERKLAEKQKLRDLTKYDGINNGNSSQSCIDPNVFIEQTNFQKKKDFTGMRNSNEGKKGMKEVNENKASSS